MAFIDWNDDFEVDNGPIDAQHRQLVEIVNKFDEAQRRGRGSRVMGEILNDLLGYTQEHFAFEEKLMAELAFAKLKQHQAQHRQLIQKLERLHFEFHTQNKRVSGEMRDFLKYWLITHISKEDKAFARVLVPQKV